MFIVLSPFPLVISNILIVINQSLQNTVDNLFRIITIIVTQSPSVSISTHASLRTLHWPLWCHSIPDYLTVLLGRMVTNRSNTTVNESCSNKHEHDMLPFFMYFLLFFFSRWSHTYVDFSDADKFSCILKAKAVTGSQITDGYISNKKNIVKKLTDSILILYRLLIIYLF